MKIRSLLIILATVLLAWFLPSFSHMFGGASSGRIMVYFSSVTQHFCVVERDANDKIIRRDITSNELYSLNEFDSVLPLLYYRQLLADGKMPDTLQGKMISAKEARQKSFYFKQKPKSKDSPKIQLFPLFESQSGRVDLKMPNDVFRLGDELAFIDPKENEIKKKKTAKFRQVFESEQFVYPAKLVAGNPSPRKPYDEGYFVIDAEDNLFHFKMIKAQPYLQKVTLPKDCAPSYFMPYEPDDHSFYGFLSDKNGNLYVLNTENYKVQKLQCGTVSLDREILAIMGNPLYWTLRIISQEKEDVFAFDAKTKKKVAEKHFANEQKGDAWHSYFFPFELRWTSPLSNFVTPKIQFGNYVVWVMNIVLALVFFFLFERRNRGKCKIIATSWIILTGIFGFIACLVFNEKE